MTETLQTQLEQVLHSMAVLESQRAALGDAVVEPALAGLRRQVAALQAQQPVGPAAPEERSLLTVLFADVVGSTAMEERLDPEQVTEIMNGAFSFMNLSVANHGGMVARLMGDAVLAFFGVPNPREDDAERAIRAGLDIQASAKVYAQSIQNEYQLAFYVRVGIHTGLALLATVGDQIKAEYTAMGDTTNIAARLQAAAPAGAVLVSHQTFRQVRGLFEVAPQPALHIKGKVDPIQTYLIRRAKPRPFRAMTRGVAGIRTRTVGRASEFESLKSSRDRATGLRRVVWAQLIGEPGVGKSRLLDDINEWIELGEQGSFLFRGRAYSIDSGQPFALIRRMWFDRFQIAEDTPLAQAEAKWVKGFLEISQSGEIEPAHALGLLVGLPFKDSPHIGAMRGDPSQVRGRAIVVSRELFKTLLAQHPIEILLEDLHWADASSWEYLSAVLLEEGFPEWHNGIFVLATARPEWAPPPVLREYPDYSQMNLLPLSEANTRELAGELLEGVEDVPAQALQMLIERSEGVPYYAEELVNWFIDQGIIEQGPERWRFIPARLRESPLPTTLQHLLLTRLSSLSENERAGLQRGAIFGRAFWEGGIAALGVLESDAILNALVPRGFVEPHSASTLEGEREWSFRHALLRDATYESVLKRERPNLHRSAAEWLEAQCERAGRTDEFAGLLGEHLERAGERGAAAKWYLRAGERAKSQGAMREAERFWSRALELLPLAEQNSRFGALLGRQEVLAILGDKDASQADVSALVALAREMGDDHLLAQALMRSSVYLNQRGEYRSELPVIDETLAAARRAGDELLGLRALAERVAVLTRLEELETARPVAAEALARARELGDVATLAEALTSAALRVVYSGDWAGLIEMYGEASALWHQLGDRYREALVRNNLGYAYVQLGLYRQATANLEQARALTEAIGARRQRAYSLQNLGLVYWRGGDRRRAREVLGESARELEAVGDALAQATSLLYLGYEQEESGNTSRASDQYKEAGDAFAELGAQGYAHDARAGQARCAFKQGHWDDAREEAMEVAHYLSEHGSAGMDSPIWAYQSCAEILAALSGPPNPTLAAVALEQAAPDTGSRRDELLKLARETIEAGYRELMDRQDKISNAQWRRSFLENVPEHRSMIELWERLPQE